MARFTKIVLIVLLIIIANKAFAKSPPPGTGTANVPANILIMLDNSGSMQSQLQSAAKLYYPVDVNVDSKGNVYVLEYSSNSIKVFDSSGNFLRSFGGWGDSRSNCNRWSNARQFDIYNDYIYIADTYNHRVSKLTLTGSCVWTARGYTGSGGREPSSVAGSYPSAIVGGNGYIWVGSGDGYICSFNAGTGSRVWQYCARPRGNSWIWGMSINKSNNKLAIAHYSSSRIGIGTISGYQIVQNYNNPYQSTYYHYCSSGSFTDTAWDTSGYVYSVDVTYHRLTKWRETTTSCSTIASTGSYSTSSGFRYPYGMEIDSSNNIYVADYYNFAIRKYNTSLVQTATIGGLSDTRLEAAKKAIKKIVSNSELTKGANFGLMQWSVPYYNRILVPISSNGANLIYNAVNNVSAVGWDTQLYGALQTARSYFFGSSSPIISGATCQKNFIIVISDGYWGNHSQVVNLVKSMRSANPSIKTIAVGFALGGSNSNYTSLAQAGCAFGDEPSCTKSYPLYADNEAQLISSLTEAIKQIISSTLTFTTPAVMSDVTKGDYVYQSTFECEPYKQWKGHLKKHKINTNGTLAAAEWDAADKLNAKAASARNIWTVGISSTGLNNFITSNRDELKIKLFPNATPTNTQVDNLINFTRGLDSYDENKNGNTSETRHKLADIYHSDISVVGPPDQSTEYQNTYQDSYYRNINKYENFKSGSGCGGSCQNRKEIVLAGSNGGMLHAFDSSNGEELWAFIPPSLLGELSKVISNRANTSNAIYGVDGSPIVKDIYYNNSWKTVVITGLGAGGHSYFALDITNPNSPSHLFTIDNDPFAKIINFWDVNGNQTQFGYASGGIGSEYDYRKLGEAWSNPRIIRMKVPNSNNLLVDKWVAVFGGGFNGATNPNYGSAVFVMDLENNGLLLKKIDITDSSSSNIVNSIPSDLTVITADSTTKANYNGAIVYASDLEGKITKINLTDKGTLYQTTQLFDAQSNTTNGRYIYKTAEATINDDNNLWLYFGTGDIQRIQDRNSNILNRLYGIKDKDFPEFLNINSAGTISNCKSSGLGCPATGDLGWYVDLPNSRKLTAMPTVQGDSVYFPLYEPTLSSNICSYGDAWLYALNSKCGNSLYSYPKKLGTGVLTKVVTNKSKIILGISGTAAQGTGFNNQGNLLIGDAVGKSQVQDVIKTETWKEN